MAQTKKAATQQKTTSKKTTSTKLEDKANNVQNVTGTPDAENKIVATATIEDNVLFVSQVVDNKAVEKKLLVALPYLKSEAQGRELEFAIYGWLRHFKEDFKLVIIGDDPGFLDKFSEQVEFVECKRVPVHPTLCTKHLDFINKMKKIIALYPEYGAMIWTFDDVYAINDFGLAEIQLLKQNQQEMYGDLRDKNRFIQDMARTRDTLVAEGKSTRNYTTHLPYYFEFEKLLELIDKFDMSNTSYVVECLYYNYFYPNRVPLQLNIMFDNIRCAIWRSNPRMEIVRAAFEKQIWIVNSPEGYIPELVKLLDEHYKR